MSGWSGYIFGKRDAPVAVDILIERLQDSHKVEDRRKTIVELKSSLVPESNAVSLCFFPHYLSSTPLYFIDNNK